MCFDSRKIWLFIVNVNGMVTAVRTGSFKLEAASKVLRSQRVVEMDQIQASWPIPYRLILDKTIYFGNIYHYCKSDST